MSHGANLMIFTSAGLTVGNPPIIAKSAETLQSPHADPLPQALILTAIVISFAVMAFLIALIYRTYKSTQTEDLDQMRITDQ
jgi:multicomponent Na+:H+ antiporter subunit C